MPTFDPKAFGERLRDALEEGGWDVKKLRQAVHTKTGGARGTSYGSVWSYVNGQAPIDPRREVVEALSELLDRLPEFLMYGEGPRTKREEQTEKARKEARVHEEGGEIEPWRESYDAMRAGMDRRSLLWSRATYFYTTEALFQGLVIDFLESGGEEFLTWSPEDIEEVAFWLVSLIDAPVDALRPVEPGMNLAMRKWPEYFAAMTMAIGAALPEEGYGRPREILKELRASQELKKHFDSLLRSSPQEQDKDA